MHLTLRANKDAYITNRVISEQRMTGSNVGEAGTLDLFKLYGVTMSGSTPNVELSRLLIHFDLTDLRSLISEGKIDPSSETFRCQLRLRDVQGPQTTPSEFTVTCNPLSRSFNEGIGRDIVQYSDLDVCNFISASRTEAWGIPGCELGGYVGTSCDFLTASGAVSLTSSMYFETGEEDLILDVSQAIVLTLSDTIPDQGFRIAYSQVEEADQRTYFVKRFGTRKAYNASKRPALIVTYNDSVSDDTGLIALDTPLTLILYNYDMGSPSYLVSGSSNVTGSNSLQLKLVTEVSGGWFSFTSSASQYGTKVGVYSASFTVPSSNPVVAAKLESTGSFRVLPVWGSLDGTVAYQTGSYLSFKRRSGSTTFGPNIRYDVSVGGLLNEIETDKEIVVRVNLFDRQTVGQRVSKIPSKSVGSTVRDTHVSIRDLDTGETVVPFDKSRGSSRCSSDSDGMWFRLFTHGWVVGHRFVVDVMTSTNGVDTIYRDVSAPFRIVATG